jgi:hypothetical protein
MNRRQAKTAAELDALRIPDSSQIAVSSTQAAENKRVVSNWSQFVTSSNGF